MCGVPTAVYGPHCTELEDTALRAGLDGDDVQLITEADSGYVLKFRAVELWGTPAAVVGKIDVKNKWEGVREKTVDKQEKTCIIVFVRRNTAGLCKGSTADS